MKVMGFVGDRVWVFLLYILIREENGRDGHL
jgi:hypothetical protein